MINKERIRNTLCPISSWSDALFIILSIFACTFFIYKDFGLRMILGFGILGGILAIYLARRILLGERPQFSPIEIAFGFFALALLICFLRPDSRHDSNIISYMISLVISGACLIFARPTERELRIAVRVLVGAAALFALSILVFKLYPDLYWDYVFPHLSEITQDMAWHYVRRGYGIPIGGNYYYANCILLIGLACVMCDLLTNHRRRSFSIASWFMALLIFAGIALTNVRGDFLAASAACIFVFVFSTRFSRPKEVLRKFLVLIALCLAAVLLLSALNAYGLVPRYASTIENFSINQIFVQNPSNAEVPPQDAGVQPQEPLLPPADSTAQQIPSNYDITSGRTDLWRIALNLFREHPILGVGWGSFAQHIPEQWKGVHGDQVTNVHNFVLQFLCETGLIGAIALLFPIGYIYLQTLAQTIRLKKRTDCSKWVKHANLTSLTIQTFFCAGGMLNTTIFQFVFWCCYAISVILASTALRMEGYGFHDPVSRLLRTVFDFCKPPVLHLWNRAAGLCAKLLEKSPDKE